MSRSATLLASAIGIASLLAAGGSGSATGATEAGRVELGILGSAPLLQLNGTVAGWGGLVYMRPLPEMNGHWNEYCAFNRDGSSRGLRYSTSAFRKAFARIAVVARGVCERDAPQARPPARGRSRSPRLEGANRLESAGLRLAGHPGELGGGLLPRRRAGRRRRERSLPPVDGRGVGGERAAVCSSPKQAVCDRRMGLWGIDDPTFVEGMAAFVKSHPRMELLAYFNRKPGSIWDLGSKPRSRAACRRLITPLGR